MSFLVDPLKVLVLCNMKTKTFGCMRLYFTAKLWTNTD